MRGRLLVGRLVRSASQLASVYVGGGGGGRDGGGLPFCCFSRMIAATLSLSRNISLPDFWVTVSTPGDGRREWRRVLGSLWPFRRRLSAPLHDRVLSGWC